MIPRVNVVHLLLSDYDVDSRVKNQTKSLASIYNVSVVCYGSKTGFVTNSRVSESLDIVRHTRLSGFKILKSWISIIRTVRKIRPKILHAHDAASLPLASIIAMLCRCKVIYDSHELWSEAHHAPRSKVVLGFAKWLERFLGKRVSRVITVSNSISDYLKAYFSNPRISVVRNTPSYMIRNTSSLLSKEFVRDEWGVRRGATVLLYQGLVSRDRGVPLIIDAMKSMRKGNVQLVIMGDGPDLFELKRLVVQENLQNLVLFHRPVLQSELIYYTSSADIGVHAIRNTCLNHNYCLPNKLFEYLSAGIPVIVTGLYELQVFVSENSFGLTFEDGNCQSLVQKIIEGSDTEKLRELTENVSANPKAYAWSTDESELFRVYEMVLYDD